MVMQLMPPINQQQQQQSRLVPMQELMRDIRRDTPTSNLEALRYLQTMSQQNPTALMQPMSYINQGGLVSLPVVSRGWGGGIGSAIGGIGRGISRAVKGAGSAVKNIGKGLTGALTGGGSTSDILKNMVAGGLLTYFLSPYMATATPLQKAGIRFARGYGLPSIIDKGWKGITKDPFATEKLLGGATYAGIGGLTDQFVADTPIDIEASPEEIIAEGGFDLPAGAKQPTGIGKLWAKAKSIPGTVLAERGDIPGLPNIGSDYTVTDLVKDAGTAVANVKGQEAMKTAQLAEDTAKEAAQRLTDQWRAGKLSNERFAQAAIDDPGLYRYVYKYKNDPQTIANILDKMTEGSSDIAVAQMFRPAEYWTESGRELGTTTYGAQGGGISKLQRRAGGPAFFEGRVPNTVDPRSDGMSDSETMLITNPRGTQPTGIMKISEDEYVMSAPDMAILGNGSPQAGAQVMDQFRKDLRTAAYGTQAHQPRLNQQEALQSLTNRAFG